MSSKSNIEDYMYIGFDLDDTLARYKAETFLPTTYNLFVKSLIDQQGISADVFADYPFDFDFGVKGSMIDKECGRIIQVDDNHRILRSYKKWPPVLQTEECGQEVTDLASERYFKVSNIFEMTFPQIFLILAMHNSEKTTYNDIFTSLRRAVISQYGDYNQGGYYPLMREKPEIFFHPLDTQILNLLKDLRSHAKVFLVTNSKPQYAETVLSYIFGEDDWRKWFDVTVFGSKPTFWTSKTAPFQQVTYLDNEHVEIVAEYIHTVKLDSSLYLGGCGELLFASMGVNANERILYLGDHMLTDCRDAEVHIPNMDTVALVGELEIEDDNPYWEHFLHHDTAKNKTWWGHLLENLRYASPHIPRLAETRRLESWSLKSSLIR